MKKERTEFLDAWDFDADVDDIIIRLKDLKNDIKGKRCP